MGPARLTVVYADDHLIAADKPAGQHTAPLREGEAGTLLELILREFPEVSSVPGVKPAEHGLLNRLDRDTSGLVIAARTAEAFGRMQSDFAAGRARKEYLAVCTTTGARAPDAPLHVTSRFAPYGPGRRKVRVVKAARGVGRAEAAGARRGGHREATEREYRTDVEVLGQREGLVLVRASLARGFRHQVRAHLAHLGLPILGDPLYGTPLAVGAAPGAAAPAAPRMFLHASAVELPHPADGRRLRIACPIPVEFADLFPGQLPADLAP